MKLQSSTVDILEAYQQIEDVKRFYRGLREEIQTDFNQVYKQSERMAAYVDIEPSKPRTCGRQKNRPNAEAVTVEKWYKVNIAILFSDHIIVELDSQFLALAQTSSRLLGLVPSVVCSIKDLDISETVELYRADLPSPELFEQELARWRDIHLHKPADKRPSTGASECDSCLFPSISVLLQILRTLPVIFCECERNASALR